jgi:hypothetical protein
MRAWSTLDMGKRAITTSRYEDWEVERADACGISRRKPQHIRRRTSRLVGYRALACGRREQATALQPSLDTSTTRGYAYDMCATYLRRISALVVVRHLVSVMPEPPIHSPGNPPFPVQSL